MEAAVVLTFSRPQTTSAVTRGAARLFVDLGLAAPLLPELLPMVGLPQGLPRPDGPALPPPGQSDPTPQTPQDSQPMKDVLKQLFNR